MWWDGERFGFFITQLQCQDEKIKNLFFRFILISYRQILSKLYSPIRGFSKALQRSYIESCPRLQKSKFLTFDESPYFATRTSGKIQKTVLPSRGVNVHIIPGKNKRGNFWPWWFLKERLFTVESLVSPENLYCNTKCSWKKSFFNSCVAEYEIQTVSNLTGINITIWSKISIQRTCGFKISVSVPNISEQISVFVPSKFGHDQNSNVFRGLKLFK